MATESKQPIKLELLSPAKNLEVGRVAILAGADAVYIGAPQFGARHAAGNCWEDIAALADFAHQYYAKVYLTLNTIFFDQEKEIVKQSIKKAKETGIDALIIQDMGILEMNLLGLPVFASTQTHNYDLEQIKFLEKVGFSRVILARELSLEQIKEIRAKTSVELETFIHGSLCVSFSGRCYLSQALADRSANRGLCLQACRLPFSLYDSQGKILVKDKHLLSLKDLNLSGHLEELAEAGVNSFKIEGRLKDAAYVGNVTAFYRQELDQLIARQKDKYAHASSGICQYSFRPDLQKTFNRGYTKYFYHGREGEILSPDNPKSLGKPIGFVKKIGRDFFELDKKISLPNNSGLCWFDRDKKLVGGNTNSCVEGKIYLAKKILPPLNATVYQNQDLNFEKSIINGLSRKIPLVFTVSHQGRETILSASDNNGNQTSLKIKNAQIANNKDRAAVAWREQLSKLGDTIFSLENCIFNWEQPLFVPPRELNDYRRQLIQNLLKTREEKRTRPLAKKVDSKSPYFKQKLNYCDNVANSLAEKFYHHHGVSDIEPPLERQKNYSGRRLATTKFCLRYWLGFCPKQTNAKKVKTPLYLKGQNINWRLEFDCKNCQMEIWQD